MTRSTFWIGPGLTAALALAFYGPFGMGRDFGAFVVGLFFVLPMLGVLTVVSGAWSLLDRRPASRIIARSLFLAALAPTLLIPALWGFGDPVRDPARYTVWAAFHAGKLSVLRRSDGVFMHWDSWGMAGNDNDSYLASDPSDTLARSGVADRWAAAHRLGCDIVSVRRMERGVYLLTTSNCLLDNSVP